MVMAMAQVKKIQIPKIPIQQLLEDLGKENDISPEQEDLFLRCFCPIHKDRVFRTLLIDMQLQTFKCSYTRCSGFRGGSLIDLFALTFGCSQEEAMSYWNKKMRGVAVSLDDISRTAPNPSSDTQIIPPKKSAQSSSRKKSKQKDIEREGAQLIPYDQFLNQLLREIKRSQRYLFPLSLIVLEVGDSSDEKKEHVTNHKDDILAALSRATRGSDVVTYCGVNKLAICLPQIGEQQAAHVARRLQSAISDEIRSMTPRGTPPPKIHYGISSVKETDDKDISGEELISQAIFHTTYKAGT